MRPAAVRTPIAARWQSDKTIINRITIRRHSGPAGAVSMNGRADAKGVRARDITRPPAPFTRVRSWQSGRLLEGLTDHVQDS
jgi:hypothetical protein